MSIERYYNAVENERVKHIPFSERVIKRALNRQVEPVFKDLPGNSDTESALSSLIKGAPIKEAYIFIYQMVGSDFASASFSMIKSDGRKIDTKALEDLKITWRMALERIAGFQSAERIKGVTDYTIQIVKDVLRKANMDGLSIPNTVKELRKKWIDITRLRAQTIARTEIITASNAGSLLGAESTGLPLDKIWVATPDPRVRDTHLAAHLKARVAMDQPFVVGGERLMHPGDSSLGASAENVINCRCTQVYARKGQEPFF